MVVKFDKPQHHEIEAIARITERAFTNSKMVIGGKIRGGDRMDLHMDLCAVHSNGTELDFERLEKFPDYDFAHDIMGIRRHLDRKTGKLTDCFLPRCAK